MNQKSTAEYKGPDGATIKNFFVMLFLFAFLIFMFDGFVVYHIPDPEPAEGIFSTHGYSPISAGEPYEGAKLLSVDRSHPGFMAYLLEYEGETHLLLYEFHFITERGKLITDQIVDPSVDQTYEAKVFLCKYKLPIENGKLGQVESYGLNKYASVIYSPSMIVYFALATVLALLESALFAKLRKKKQTA